MTDVSMGNHTKLVISYGCTPPFWLVVTRRNFTIPGKDHIVYSRGQRTAPTRQSLRNPRERTVVHFNRLKPCTTATAEQPSALDHISPSPGDDNSTKDTPQAAPIGTHLEIIELMEPHVQEQQLPSPPSLVQTVLVGGIQLAVDSLQIVLVSSSRFEIVCRIRDVFFQRGELCNVVQCCNFHNCYVCVCIFTMLSSIHPY